MFDQKNLVILQTVDSLVEAYHKSCETIKEGIRLLYEGQKILEGAYGKETAFLIEIRVWQSGKYDKDFQDLELRMRRDAWRRIVNMSNIDKMLSSDRADKIGSLL